MQVGAVQGSTASPLARAYYDPRDTNQDGVVSAAEAMAYAARHPDLEVGGAATGAQGAGTYGKSGSPDGSGTGAGRSLDLYA